MGTVRAFEPVALDAGRAMRLWTDLRRWPTFVEGFGHVVDVERDWPAEGGKLVWQSTPGGRGRVTEHVTARGPHSAGASSDGQPDGLAEQDAVRIESQVFEDALTGTQTLVVAPDPGGEGAEVELSLDYELARSGPLRRLADVLFIRRALSDALGRTLRRFAIEAEEEASL